MLALAAARPQHVITAGHFVRTADPPSIAASVIAVVTFALQGTRNLSDVVGTYKDAGSALADLEQDVNGTKATLTSIKSSLENSNDSNFSDSVRKCLEESKSAIQGWGAACEDFSRELAKIMSNSKDGEVSKRDKVKLWFREKAIQGLRYRLGSYKSTLNIVLTLATIKTIDQNQSKTSDLQRDLEKAVNTITDQIQGLAISEPAVFEAKESADGQELIVYDGALTSQRAGLVECLKTCSYTLAEVASETGTTVEHPEALNDATQLLGTFGDIKGTDFAAASTKIRKMIAKDRAFQAAGTFSENSFFQALSRNKK